MSYGLWIVASACGLLAMTFIPNDAHSGFISFLPSTGPVSLNVGFPLPRGTATERLDELKPRLPYAAVRIASMCAP